MPSPAKSAPLRHLAANSADIPENGRLVVDVGDTTIGIFRVGGRLFAYENSCPHMGGPLCQGRDIPAVSELISSHEANRVDGTDRLLALINLEIWSRMYLDGRTPDDVTSELKAMLARKQGSKAMQPPMAADDRR